MSKDWITVLTLIPALAALLCLVFHSRPKLARGVSILSSFGAMTLCVLLFRRFDSQAEGMQFTASFPWIPSLGIDYHVGVDGVSLLLVLLTGILGFIVVVASAGMIRNHQATYYSLILFCQCTLFGVFTALNFVHWFVFWELSLVPVFFLIKIWGNEDRNYAAIKFFLYTMVGSIPMFLGFQAIYLATGGVFDFTRLHAMAQSGELQSRLVEFGGSIGFSSGGVSFPSLVFWAIFLAFAIKTPMWPLHTWLPDAYSQAPAPVSMMLTGLYSKMGLYGMLRLLLPLFPAEMQRYGSVLLWFAFATIVLAALSALVQKDLKRLIAYSSMNHLGYALLGIFAVSQISRLKVAAAVPGVSLIQEGATALNGVLLLAFSHGLIAPALFYLAGVLQARTGNRELESFGGLGRALPLLYTMMGFTVFASIGLPGLGGFISEFMIFKGAFPLARTVVCLSLLGLLLTAVFYLKLIRMVFHGPINEKWKAVGDLTPGEVMTAMPFIVMSLAIGLYPVPWLQVAQVAMEGLVNLFR